MQVFGSTVISQRRSSGGTGSDWGVNYKGYQQGNKARSCVISWFQKGRPICKFSSHSLFVVSRKVVVWIVITGENAECGNDEVAFVLWGVKMAKKLLAGIAPKINNMRDWGNRPFSSQDFLTCREERSVLGVARIAAGFRIASAATKILERFIMG